MRLQFFVSVNGIGVRRYRERRIRRSDLAIHVHGASVQGLAMIIEAAQQMDIDTVVSFGISKEIDKVN